MAVIDVLRHSQLPAEDAWARLTDWERHGDFIPFTTVEVSGPAGAVGARIVARTAIRGRAFEDPMEVTRWQPPSAASPGVCRIVKQGQVVGGWAQLTVAPVPDGSLVHWQEEAHLRFGGPLVDKVNKLLGRLLFGRLVDGLLR